jgi:cephalosporin hydroxylase
MKTLFYTSIYSNLWGTEFGGRPGRELHYKYSLLNILNLNANKFICFTSEEELNSLEEWFYVVNKVPKEKLEFIVFNLKDSKYFDEINKLKNIDSIKKSDRCYEVQYNKFFWIDLIPEIDNYDKIFWIDAGLSHGGIFPEKYSYGIGYERHFNFTLFNEDTLNKLIKSSKDKLLILNKNNSHSFYWSTNIPVKYYNNFNNSSHIIGGLFGGSVNNLRKFKVRFEQLLSELLSQENELYFEELIMSCLYQNFKTDFTCLNFDDWYDRGLPKKLDHNVKYFYNMFEITDVCISTVAIEIDENSTRYITAAKKLIESNLLHTNYDILILTNRPDDFSYIDSSRVIIVDYDSKFSEPIISGGRFNMHIKRRPIQLAKDLGYGIIYYNDCDCYIVGWDEEDFSNTLNDDFDIAFVLHANPQLGGLRETYPHFQEKIDKEFVGLYYDELDNSPNPAETRVIFKNNGKLNDFLHFWGLISEQNKDYSTYHDGVYFGTSSLYSKMKMIGIDKNKEFTNYCRISHGNNVLNYFGHRIEVIKEIEEVKEIKTDSINLDMEVRGSFSYKGLSMLQHQNVINVFRELLLKIKPKRIIEIGTEYGGLTLLLSDLIKELDLNETIIRSYDIKVPTFLISHSDFNDKIEIITKDLFSYNPFSLKLESITELKEFMCEPGSNIILCDGGNKIGEFNVISDIIGIGDIIMAHDYAKNDEVFVERIQNKIWNWNEIQESDIIDSINKNNLNPFMETEFENVAWVCKIKE